jgi:hypothetical protein
MGGLCAASIPLASGLRQPTPGQSTPGQSMPR